VIKLSEEPLVSLGDEPNSRETGAAIYLLYFGETNPMDGGYIAMRQLEALERPTRNQ
jgi:hypothetical protein